MSFYVSSRIYPVHEVAAVTPIERVVYAEMLERRLTLLPYAG